VKTRFQNSPFKCNLQRYDEVSDLVNLRRELNRKLRVYRRTVGLSIQVKSSLPIA
jgi:hypothetical protein